ncbi:MAG: radical SAM protein [Oligoflexia bacterium]|nr:radical SAM protein [Oligoflexia bacterium]
MQESKYNQYIPYEDGHLLFNSASLNLSFVDNEHLKKINDKRYCDGHETEMKDFLQERGFIVNTDHDELKEVINKYQKLRDGADKEFDICLVMNNRCNLQCVYCYQDHSKNTEITNEILGKIATTIKDEIVDAKKILIHFFGGEPTLSMSKIKYFVELIKQHEISNVEYAITTNGYAITKDKIEQLISDKINTYQITIDGNPDIHNKQRITKDGRGSYSIILSNIKLLLDAGAEVAVRINITKNNYNNLDTLLTELKELKNNKGNGKISIALNEAVDYSDIQDDNTFFRDRKEFAEHLLEVYKKLDEYGFPIPFPSRDSFCTMMSKNGFVINPDGTFGQCSVSHGEALGHINNGFKSVQDNNARLGTCATEREECKNCDALPFCYGGCKLLRDMNKDSCSFFKYIIPGLMQFHTKRKNNNAKTN